MKTNYRCSRSLQQFYTGGPFVVSSDGSFIVCACGDSVKIVDIGQVSDCETIDVSEAVTALALSPDNKILFTAGHSRQIRVWELSTKKCLRSWKGHDGPVMTMACHASGGLLATGGADRKVLIWDVDGGFCTHHFKNHKGVVTCLMFHPDSKKNLLFSGSDDSTVRVWNLVNKKCMATLEKHFSTVTSIDISEDGETLVSAGRDKVVNIWSVCDYSFKKTLPVYEVLEAVCIVPSNSQLSYPTDFRERKSNEVRNIPSSINFVTVGERGIVRLWNSERAACLYEQKSSDLSISSDNGEGIRGFISAMILPSNQGMLCVTADQQFFVYVPVGLPGNDGFQIVLSKRLIGNNEEILDMRFLGDDEQKLAVATNTEQVRVYDLSSMSCSYVLSGHSDIVLCLDSSLSNSGKPLIVTGSKDKKVMLWDAEQRNCIGVGIGHMEGVGAVAFSKKSRNFFVSGSSDRTIKVWSFEGFSSDLEKPVNLVTKAVVSAHEKDINSLTIAPNDSMICSGSQDRTARVWKLPNLVPVSVLKGHKRGIWCVEFSPVDQCVITASGDKTVKIWAIADGSCLKTFEGHTSSVLRVSFLTRGTQFVSSGADGLLKLWTVKTNECIATYDQHEDKIWSLAVGKKTEMIATGGGDSVINLWNDSTASEKEEAFQKEEDEVLRGQELENAVIDAEYAKAIQLAFQLRKPHRLLELLTQLSRERDAEKHILKALQSLGSEEHRQLLDYIREWNTKPKTCHIAQYVLFLIFRLCSPLDIVKIKGISEVLEGLIPYSQRHYARVDRLERSSFLVEYALKGLSVLQPTNGCSEVLTEATSKKRKSSRTKGGSSKKVSVS